jgi:hypothetical protein
MELPNLELAEVSREKILEYLLNPLHPTGTGKSKFFISLGYSDQQWQHLAEALRNIAQHSPISQTVESVHGWKYIIDGTVDAPNGTSASVRTVWIIDRGAVAPRLVTAYPHEKGP